MTPPAGSFPTPAADAPVEAWIRWLTGRRKRYPQGPLGDWIDPRSLSPETLTELACVDLILQRRTGRDATVEDYLGQFPSLGADPERVLDLIDAEICIRQETGDQRSAAFYQQRFPDCGGAIEQLLALVATPPVVGGSIPDVSVVERMPQRVDLSADDSFGQSADSRSMTVAGRSENRPPPEIGELPGDAVDVPVPIAPPRWMLGARCLATRSSPLGRSWLLTGRDASRGDTVAMKILPLPTDLDRRWRTQILDLCEWTSNVTHPAWITPRVAAIDNGHLAVIRPWVFGRVCQRPTDDGDVGPAVDALARVGFALTAAHRGAATHGNVCEANLIWDHDDQLVLVDAAASQTGWPRTLNRRDDDLDRTTRWRIRIDTIGYLQTIAAVCVAAFTTDSGAGHSDLAGRWIGRLTADVDPCGAEACATIGERLQRLQQDPPTGGRRWWSLG